MEEHVIVDSGFSAVINAPLEKMDIPVWCLSLPDEEYQGCSPAHFVAAWSYKTFEYGTWGGEIRLEFAPQPGDVVTLEHWCSSGFANTDLDFQLKQHSIHQLIVMGLLAHTCVETTVRHAVELGYQVTMVKDATASYSDEQMHAALDTNLPNYASAVLTADEVSESIALSSL